MIRTLRLDVVRELNQALTPPLLEAIETDIHQDPVQIRTQSGFCPELFYRSVQSYERGLDCILSIECIAEHSAGCVVHHFTIPFVKDSVSFRLLFSAETDNLLFFHAVGYPLFNH
jgi:hypothetical protein